MIIAFLHKRVQVQESTNVSQFPFGLLTKLATIHNEVLHHTGLTTRRNESVDTVPHCFLIVLIIVSN